MTASPSTNRSMRTPGRSYGHARLLVVADHPAGAEADLEPTVGQHVHRGQLLGEHDRVLVVVVPHERADAQVGGRVGGRHQRRHRRELVAEVVGHRQHRVAVGLGAAASSTHSARAAGLRRLDAEAERSGGERGGGHGGPTRSARPPERETPCAGPRLASSVGPVCDPLPGSSVSPRSSSPARC